MSILTYDVVEHEFTAKSNREQYIFVQKIVDVSGADNCQILGSKEKRSLYSKAKKRAFLRFSSQIRDIDRLDCPPKTSCPENPRSSVTRRGGEFRSECSLSPRSPPHNLSNILFHGFFIKFLIQAATPPIRCHNREAALNPLGLVACCFFCPFLWTQRDRIFTAMAKPPPSGRPGPMESEPT